MPRISFNFNLIIRHISRGHLKLYIIIITIIKVFCPRAGISLQAQEPGLQFYRRQVLHRELRNQDCRFTRDWIGAVATRCFPQPTLSFASELTLKNLKTSQGLNISSISVLTRSEIRKSQWPFASNTSIHYTVLYITWHFLLLVYNVQYETISMCRLGVGKTIKNVINTWKGSVLWSSVMNSGGPWLGYRRGARCAGKRWRETPPSSCFKSLFCWWE